jgi:hypothetical protein
MRYSPASAPCPASGRAGRRHPCRARRGRRCGPAARGGLRRLARGSSRGIFNRAMRGITYVYRYRDGRSHRDHRCYRLGPAQVASPRQARTPRSDPGVHATRGVLPRPPSDRRRGPAPVLHTLLSRDQTTGLSDRPARLRRSGAPVTGVIPWLILWLILWARTCGDDRGPSATVEPADGRSFPASSGQTGEPDHDR